MNHEPERAKAMYATTSSSSRRSFLAAAGGIAGAGLISLTSARTAQAATSNGKATRSSRRTRAVLLGTAGGPAASSIRSGTSTAICYGERVYVVDVGFGAGRALIESGLGGRHYGDTLLNVRGIFLTHLHSDHIADWPAIYAVASINRRSATEPISVFGPGPRSSVPPVFPAGRPAPEVINPNLPMPGIGNTSAYLTQALAADFNDRMRDGGWADPRSQFTISDIDTGPYVITDDGVPPTVTSPIQVWTDGDVQVSATLVDHRPTAPAFAFRFDTPDGSIVVSGDTAPSENLVRLAQGADILIHEVIDEAWVDSIVASMPPGPQTDAMRNHLLVSHTSLDQVAGIAGASGVGHLVLNHIVPPDTPPARLNAARGAFRGRFTVGTDFDVIDVH
ncbi:MBL fold metallo-hydrolase [Agromyces soli]